MTIECNTDSKQDNANSTCCCKGIFSKDNLFIKCIVMIIVAIFTCFLYNTVNEWLEYRKAKKLINEMTLVVDDFGFTISSSNFQPAYINSKMFICYLAKQQEELLKKQNLIIDKLSKLTERRQGEVVSPTIVDEAAVQHKQQQNAMPVVQEKQQLSSKQDVSGVDNKHKTASNV